MFPRTAQQHRLIHPGMAEKQPDQFQTGIAGRAQHRDFEFACHQASISRMRPASLAAAFLLPQTIRIVSSPATVPMASGHCSPSRAAATGWALPTLVFTTNKFCAIRVAATNSRTSRETGGRVASEEFSPGGRA